MKGGRIVLCNCLSHDKFIVMIRLELIIVNLLQFSNMAAPWGLVKTVIPGTQSAMWPRWPGHYFCQFEKRLPQPEIKTTCRIHLEIRSNPAWCLIRCSIQQTFTHPITSYLVKKSIQGNMNRRREKRVGTGREKSPSFTKITREMNLCVHCDDHFFIFIWFPQFICDLLHISLTLISFTGTYEPTIDLLPMSVAS